ncbi:GGDEF domain-containing protein [Pleionea litopenaei]|uniref:GGDEF domain-containing protein n=1 Tax=Pleionea litopenaei TaxID=3070815 RepID=A0AA51RU30_9GAMM|nr:GGDEF domain-containing protein [Pleionea sp. HL-JVS1]WMS87530.1 GGDEF domain-containing protein [Pleionea sp. HL-JVS1]
MNIFLIFNITSIGIAAFILLYLSQIPKTKSGCWCWGIAFALQVVGYLVLLSVEDRAQVRTAEYFHVVSLLGYGTVLLFGTFQFFDIQKRQRNYIIAASVITLWYSIFFFIFEWFFAASIIPSIYMAYCVSVVGWIFYKKRHKNKEYILLSLITWLSAVHYLDYPFLRQNIAFAPYGFLIAGILNMVLVIFLLRFQFVHFRQRLIDAEALALKLAYHDSLTGLINRRRLFDLFDTLKLLVIRRKEKLTVIFIDLNDFKMINDNFGHDAGDHSLVKIARRIKSVVRDTDVVSRVGGDEFVILALSCQNQAGIEELVSRIKECLKEPLIIKQQDHLVGAAIGYAVCPDQSTNLETLLSLADSHMFKQKQAHKADIEGTENDSDLVEPTNAEVK